MEICNCDCKVGVANCDVIFQGGIKYLRRIVRRGRGKISAQNSVTSFMGGPLCCWALLRNK